MYICTHTFIYTWTHLKRPIYTLAGTRPHTYSYTHIQGCTDMNGHTFKD